MKEFNPSQLFAAYNFFCPWLFTFSPDFSNLSLARALIRTTPFFVRTHSPLFPCITLIQQLLLLLQPNSVLIPRAGAAHHSHHSQPLFPIAPFRHLPTIQDICLGNLARKVFCISANLFIYIILTKHQHRTICRFIPNSNLTRIQGPLFNTLFECKPALIVVWKANGSQSKGRQPQEMWS